MYYIAPFDIIIHVQSAFIMASCSEKDLDNQNSKLISESVTPVVRTSFIENVRNSKRQILATAIGKQVKTFPCQFLKKKIQLT